jgi:uncharacterized DUF497 family protein
MEFDWDDAKSARCLQERGFSFADVIPAFTDPDRRAEVDERQHYGETRHTLYGRVEGRLFVIVYTMRGGVHRIISARKANKRETKRYGKGTPETRSDRRRDSARRFREGLHAAD